MITESYKCALNKQQPIQSPEQSFASLEFLLQQLKNKELDPRQTMKDAEAFYKSVNKNRKKNQLKEPYTFPGVNSTKKVFKLKDEFYSILSTLPKFNTQQEFFSYKEITTYFTMYILSNKENILNCNDISIAHVENDPLGKLFNVKHFRRNQVHQLIQQHIVYQDHL
jgi:hypothetical protein